MRESKFQKIFGNTVRIKILEFFLIADELSFPISVLVENMNAKKTQIYREMKYLVKIGIIMDMGKQKISGSKNNATYYKLNRKSRVVKSIMSLYKTILKSEELK